MSWLPYLLRHKRVAIPHPLLIGNPVKILSIFAAILLAAFAARPLNALAKRKAEGRVGAGLPAASSPLPFPAAGGVAPVEYPWLALSILLHCGYCLFLGRAYRLGSLESIPLARGSVCLW